MQDEFVLLGIKEVTVLLRCCRRSEVFSIFRSVSILLFKTTKGHSTANFKLVEIILEFILILFEHG